MEIAGFPTSSDIYLELNGMKVAVVQSYRARTTRTSRPVEAFGEAEPVATIGTQKTHTIELSRLYLTEEAVQNHMDFHQLEDFSLAIVKPDRKVLYTGCRWSSITEDGELNSMVLEKISIVAARRIETTV